MKGITLLSGLAALCVTGIAAQLSANSCPPPTTPYVERTAPTLQYTGKDKKGLNIEMASEEVSLVMSKAQITGKRPKYVRAPGQEGKKSREIAGHWESEAYTADVVQLDVEVVFHMKNHGDDTNIEVGYPIGPYDYGNAGFNKFEVEYEGKKLDCKLEQREATPDDEKQSPFDRMFKSMAGYDVKGMWYVWNMTFKKGVACDHTVRYTLYLHRNAQEMDAFDRWSDPFRAEYILHTGASWKNQITRSLVTLRCKDGMTLDHIRRVAPLTGARRLDDRIEWVFENYEPKREHDIHICYTIEEKPKTWADELAELREQAKGKGSWTALYGVMSLLEEAPMRAGRTAMTKEELDAWLSAIGSLVTDPECIEARDGKFYLPVAAGEICGAEYHWPSSMSPFAPDGDNDQWFMARLRAPDEVLLGLFQRAVAAVEQHPTNAQAKEVAAKTAAYCRHIADSTLFAKAAKTGEDDEEETDDVLIVPRRPQMKITQTRASISGSEDPVATAKAEAKAREELVRRLEEICRKLGVEIPAAAPVTPATPAAGTEKKTRDY